MSSASYMIRCAMDFLPCSINELINCETSVSLYFGSATRGRSSALCFLMLYLLELIGFCLSAHASWLPSTTPSSCDEDPDYCHCEHYEVMRSNPLKVNRSA